MSLNATVAAETDSADVQPYRPVTAYYTLDAGSSSIVDTYLTPLRYSGWSVGFGYDRWQAFKRSPEDWLMNLRLNVNVDRDENLTGNATMWNLGLAFSWGMYRRWTLHSLGGITVGAGPRARIDVGCLPRATVIIQPQQRHRLRLTPQLTWPVSSPFGVRQWGCATLHRCRLPALFFLLTMANCITRYGWATIQDCRMWRGGGIISDGTTI